ncbi:hypothetical protein HDV05_005303 [Chytridiales sp. JEL 0842]|nr:hypothetical protein HDV05_005303 [Chytridiales sp. JEL 0842]
MSEDDDEEEEEEDVQKRRDRWNKALGSRQTPVGIDLKKSTNGKQSSIHNRLGKPTRQQFDSDDSASSSSSSDSDTPPSTKSKNRVTASPKKKLPVPTLSPFGRIWTLLDTLVTDTTRSYITSKGTMNLQEVEKGLLDAKGLDWEAFLVRRNIFSERIVKSVGNLKSLFSISTNLTPSLLSLLSTLHIPHSHAVLPPFDERVVSVVLLWVLTELLPELKEEKLKWEAMMEGTGMGRAEVEVFGRLFRGSPTGAT